MGFEKVEHLLPDTVLEIVDVIGLAATEQLVKAIGGARFKFGKGKVDTERLAILVEAIGEFSITQRMSCCRYMVARNCMSHGAARR